MKNINFKDLIVFENDDYILINKPPYVSSLDERTKDSGAASIIRLAKGYSHDAQVAHRLDKETSGILAIAKHPEAYRHIAIQFEDRQVDKTYHAIVGGVHAFDGISVYLPIKAMPNGIAIIDRAEGKEAETLFFTKEAFKKNTLVECKPITGRMHQIRVHLACLKAPIVADVQYGGPELYLSEIKRNFNLKKGTEEEPLIKRVALHAFSLTFAGLNGEKIHAEADYPKDMAALIRQLRNNL